MKAIMDAPTKRLSQLPIFAEITMAILTLKKHNFTNRFQKTLNNNTE
jgi:hypothetical protein